MESLNNADLLDVTMSLLSSADVQFQGWIGVTFALILTGYLVGTKLSRKMKLIISVLYVISVYFFIDKYVVIGANSAMFIAEITERGIDWELFIRSYWGMLIVMNLGSIAAIFFFNFGEKYGKISDNKSTIAST